jgi:tRNA(fMet)-specific endonuclease VapC
MSGKYLLDTNIVIALFAKDVSVTTKLSENVEVFIPVIVIGELGFGSRKSARSTENLARFEEFIAGVVILDCDTETARQYGQIKDALRVKGRPIPENDIWIASIALRHDLILVTRDVHLSEIENLKIEAW